MTAKIIVKCIIYNRVLNRFLLVQRCKNDDTGANTWENAGGNIEGKETPEAAVFREIKRGNRYLGYRDKTYRLCKYSRGRNAQSTDRLFMRNCER